MPFDPTSPFDPADPWQWWQTHTLPHLVQPNAPPNAGLGQAPNPTSLPNGSLVPPGALEDDGFPNDWIYPDSQNAPVPATAPPTALPPPSPQPNPAVSNRPPARSDPYAAFWAQVPASRVGAMAWHPPIFLSPDSFAPQDTPSSARGGPPARFANPLAQFLPAASALPTLPPDFGTGGILGGIAKLAAEQARANDPWQVAPGGILGGIPKLAAAYVSSAPASIAASRGQFGSLANLPPTASNASAGASSPPMSRRFLPLDPIGYQGPGNLYTYVRNDPLNRGDTTGFAADLQASQTTTPITTPFPVASGPGPNDLGRAGDTPGGLGSQYYRDGRADGFPTQPSLDVGRPPIRLVNDAESPPEDKPGAPPHLKYDPSLVLNPFGESNSIAGRTGWGAGPPGRPPAPDRAGPAPAPPLQAPPPPTRTLPPASPPPGTSPPTPPAQTADSPQPSLPPIGSRSVILPRQESDGGKSVPNLPFGIGPGPFAGEPIPAGPGKRPSPAQQDQINASGNKYGCHMCGAPVPGTRSGNWIGDHQTSTALNPAGQQQLFLPHCKSCSLRQAGLVTNYLRRRGK
jgi:hypothetical protein